MSHDFSCRHEKFIYSYLCYLYRIDCYLYTFIPSALDSCINLSFQGDDSFLQIYFTVLNHFDGIFQLTIFLNQSNLIISVDFKGNRYLC